LKDDDYLSIRPEWVLRNDGDKVILYLTSAKSIEYQILDPATSAVMSLINGRRSVMDLIKTISFLFDISADSSRSLLEGIVDILNDKSEKIDVLGVADATAAEYNPLDFLVSPEEFICQHRLAKPLTLLIYFSGWCQTNCIYCYADLANMRRLKHMSLEQWVKIMEQASDLGIRMVQLTGGDPMARPDSAEFLARLAELGFVFLASTKCYVSLKDAKRLAEAGWNRPVNGVNRAFQVSIDSPDPSVCDRMMRCKGYLERATESLQNLMEAGIEPKVKAVLTPINYHQAFDYVEAFSEIGIKTFHFTCYSRSHYRHDDELFLDEEMKRKASELLLAARESWPDLSIEGDAVKYMPKSEMGVDRAKIWDSRAGCSAGRTTLGIAPDGSAVLCEQMPLERQYFFGDLKRESILEVWNSPELLRFICPPKEKFEGTPCHICADFDFCVHDTGHCFRDALFAYGKMHHPPPNCPKVPAGEYRSI
jgi:MoaA/NifB/PqqE/SkfB family radical SAM enzyme